MARKIALIVGSSEYADPKFSQLKGPPLDVEAFAEVLRDPNIGGFDQVDCSLNEPLDPVRRQVFDLFDGRERDDLLPGKAPTDGVFGTVQASARVFIFQALSAWTVLEATGQTEQLVPDFQAWLHSILESEVPYVRRVSSVKVTIPKH